MKAWTVMVALVALSGAVVGAGLLGLRAQASAESASNALVLAEREAQAKSKADAAAAPEKAPDVPTTRSIDLDALSPSVTFRQTSTYNGAPVYVPEGCRGAYDVVLHFHGAHSLVRDQVQKAELNAVVAVFNAGIGAEKYGQAFSANGTLSSLLRQVELATTTLCPEGTPRRIALLGFSAGYAAVEKLLTRPEDRARVDAALLADGLHAGFTDPWKRQLAPNALLPFREFGELAKRGEKLMAVTHSSIMTDGYASTTECSRFLLRALEVPCDDPLVSGKQGDFSVEGFTGTDKEAHILQFRQMGTTLLSKLRARWTR
jgi:hypothetical protein